MFPMSEFHFVFGGVAAVAATVGYRLARRRASSASWGHDRSGDKYEHPSSQDDIDLERKSSRFFFPAVARPPVSDDPISGVDIEKAPPTTGPGALKRKNTEDDHYRNEPDADESKSETPNPTKKRNTTPPLALPHNVASSPPIPLTNSKRRAEDDGGDDSGNPEDASARPPRKRSRTPTPHVHVVELPESERSRIESKLPTPPLDEDEYIVIAPDDKERPDASDVAFTPEPAIEAPETVERPSSTPAGSVASPALSSTPDLPTAASPASGLEAESLFRHMQKLRQIPSRPKTPPAEFTLRPSILGHIAAPSPRPASPSSGTIEFNITRGPPRTSSPFATVQNVTPMMPSHGSGGFAAFAGGASPFIKTVPGSLSLARRPIWNEERSASPLSVRSKSPTPVRVFSREDTEPVEDRKASPEPGNTRLTGEEGEEVLAEVRGVRMFVKRGNKPFGGSMTGTLRHLVHKESQEERLLFRREPLWQPAMNARLSPALRCMYDETEQVLRVLSVEPVQQEGACPEKQSHELVVYAVKPRPSDAESGRAAHAFKAFAEGVIGSHLLKGTA